MITVRHEFTSIDTELTSQWSALTFSTEVFVVYSSSCSMQTLLAGYFALDRTHLGKWAPQSRMTQYWRRYRRGHGPGSRIHSLLYASILRVHACNLLSNLGPLWGLAFTHVWLLFHWWLPCIDFNLLSSTTALGVFSSLECGLVGTDHIELQVGTTFVPGPLWVRFFLHHTLPIHNWMTIICTILDVCIHFLSLSDEWLISIG